jgi:hypothetical protein
MGATITYNNQNILLEQGKTLTLTCAEKVFRSNIVINDVAENEEVRIQYNDTILTTVTSGQTVTLTCAGLKELKAKSNIIFSSILNEETNNGTEGLKYTLSEDGTFYTCSGLENNVTETDLVIASEINSIPVTKIASSAFDGYTDITSISIPNSITSIGERAFSYCSSIAVIKIPNSVASLGTGAFYMCRALQSVVLGNGITTIADSIFTNCNNLTKIAFSDQVTHIGASAFDGCFNLTDVYYSGTDEQWKTITIAEDNNEWFIDATVHYNTSGLPE